MTLLIALAAMAACVPSHESKSPAPATQVPETAQAYDVESKTVALVMYRNGNAHAYCSGVWVTQNAFMTANHCTGERDVNDKVAYVVRGDLSVPDGDETEALRVGTLAARDAAHDLALVTVKLPPTHAIAPVAREVWIGAPVQTMGHPLGLWWSYSTGNVAGVRALDDGTWYVQSSAPISPGNSGGALFNASGEVLGICSFYYPSGENVNFYVHAMHVRAFMESSL
jgi:S1-C subfamily serine protease